MKVQIIFGTEVGTTKYVVEIMQKKLSKENHSVDFFEAGMEKKMPNLEDYDLILFGAPTYYGGQLESKMAKLLAEFSPDLNSYKVAVFGLGDSSYSDFCAAAEILENWITQHKGKVLLPALKIDGYPTNTDPILQWVEKVLTHF